MSIILQALFGGLPMWMNNSSIIVCFLVMWATCPCTYKKKADTGHTVRPPHQAPGCCGGWCKHRMVNLTNWEEITLVETYGGANVRTKCTLVKPWVYKTTRHPIVALLKIYILLKGHFTIFKKPFSVS